MTIHRHWYFFFRTTLFFLFLAITPVGLIELVFASGAFPSDFAVLISSFLTAVYILWWLVLWGAYAIAWTDYYLDTWTINDTDIRHVEQNGFFDRRITTWQLDTILDVTTHTDGFIASLLGFGTLTIETAGVGEENESFAGTPHPEKVKSYILTRVRDVQALAEKNKEQALQIKSISHDAKGHLTKSQAVLAGIIEGDFGVVPESVKSIASTALSDTKRGVSSMTQVLSQDHTVTRFSLSDIVTAEVESLRPLASQKNIEVVSDIAPTVIEGDKDALLRDVIKNLLQNALIYTPSGQITVTLKPEGTHAVLTVTDTGVGITNEDQKQLFTAGGHGTHSKDINPASTGNGLFLAYETVTRHHGTINAMSEGRGSTFTVTLPLA